MSGGKNTFVLFRRLRSRPNGVHNERVLGYCELAALRAARALAGEGGTVTAVTVGRARREDKALDFALTTAADRAIRVSSSGCDRLDFLGTAQVITAVLKGCESVDAVLCGDRSEDSLSGAVGPAVAELLGVPHLCGVLGIEEDADSTVVATTRSAGRIHRFRVGLPAVLCIRDFPGALEVGAREPGPIEVRSFRDLGLAASELAARSQIQSAISSVRPGNNATMVTTAGELLHRLVGDHLLPK